MSGKDLKPFLKQARDAIKNKDYQTSLRVCKNILKTEKDNYMALVFLGISLQEAGPIEQAPLAFRKALQLDPNQILAWNGLANYYEKQQSAQNDAELIKVYSKLLEFETDANKVEILLNKLVTIVLKQQDNYETPVDAIKKVTENENVSANLKRNAWISLASLLTQINNLSKDYSPLLETALSKVISDDSNPSINYKQEYLKLLYKENKLELLYNEATKFLEKDSKNVYILEWICKLYVESVIEATLIAEQIQESIENVSENLKETDPKSSMVLFVKAVRLYTSEKYLEARLILEQVVAARSGLMHAWVLLANCFLRLLNPNEAVVPIQKADKLLQSINNSKPNLRKTIDYALVEALSKHTSGEEHWRTAVDLSNRLLEVYENDCSLLNALANAQINLKNYVEANRIIDVLKTDGRCDQKICLFLDTNILRGEGKLDEALRMLLDNEDIDTPEYYGRLGVLYWDLGRADKCLVPLLKAAKLQPEGYIWFLYLGRYYSKMHDFDKARRCYEKTFKLYSNCTSAGIELSDIYRKQENWEANLTLLKNITGSTMNSDNRWAWMQLGLNYLEQNESSLAIDILRSVVRADSNNSHCWECLADAYLARGAYTSALKSYQRATELSTNVLYPNLQIATIKQILGEYVEARKDFESALLLSQRYVPALKGLAETCLCQAKQYSKTQQLGLARDCAQYAVDKLSVALQESLNLACLWKLIGDCCVLIAGLSERYNKLTVPKALVRGGAPQGSEEINKEDIYILAARCYCKALHLNDDNILIWHDLSACYYSHALMYNDSNDKAVELCERSLSAIRYCISKNSTQWEHWNMLGVIASDSHMKRYAMAQHAFIRAVTINYNSAVSWCNLGALYLTLEDVKLANDAFTQAQRADPNYVNSWIGQAIIAEQHGHEDAMDLFRHSTQLRHHQQGGSGYGHWVCRVLLDSPPNAVIYSIHNMHAVPVASDALDWYTEHNNKDPCAWNMLGILKERLGLKRSALAAYREALRLTSDKKRKDRASINCARLLTDTGKYDDAIAMYKEVNDATFNSGAGLALAYFKAERYEESYETYKSALHWLTEDEGLQSHLLVALAAMAYMFQGPDVTKTLLFQSIQLTPPSPRGLYATLALGLLYDDITLSKLVLKELGRLKDDPNCLSHYGILLSYTHLIQGDHKSAIRELSKQLHRHPGEAALWLNLSTLLLRIKQGNMPVVGSKCAQVAMKLGRVNMDVTKVQCMVSLGSLQAKDYREALRAAQKAIHCYPDVSEGWALLSASLLLDSAPIKGLDKLPWLLKVISFILKNYKCTGALTEWLELHQEIIKETVDAR